MGWNKTSEMIEWSPLGNWPHINWTEEGEDAFGRPIGDKRQELSLWSDDLSYSLKLFNMNSLNDMHEND